MLSPTVEAVSAGLLGAQSKPWAQGCAWLEHWLLPVATRRVIPWCGQSCQGALAAPGPFGLAGLAGGSRDCSGAGLSVLFPLHEQKSSSQPALAPVAANPGAQTCVSKAGSSAGAAEPCDGERRCCSQLRHLAAGKSSSELWFWLSG